MNMEVHHHRICIVGTQQLQYELLSFCLENELGAKCVLYKELPLNFSVNIQSGGLQVWLLDCFSLDAAGIEQQFGHSLRFRAEGLLPALFNVEQLNGLNALVMEKGVRGIFLRNDSRQVFLKGIRAILSGQMWLTRKTLSECILERQRHFNPVARSNQTLSNREKDILLSVAAGSSNQQIAKELDLSVHTIKTHLYKIYRKINVHNRLQATLWVNTFLH